MPEGGKLTIETSNVEIDEEHAAPHVGMNPGLYVQVTVADTGCGMDERTRARVFEPFFTTKEPGRGAGLGLAMVLGLLSQAGGFVLVDSREGDGTTVDVYLRRAVDTADA